MQNFENRRQKPAHRLHQRPSILRPGPQSTAAIMAENDDVFGKDGLWTKERVLGDWNVSLEYARNKLLIEKVKGRVAFLREILSIVKSVGTCKCNYCCIINTD